MYHRLAKSQVADVDAKVRQSERKMPPLGPGKQCKEIQLDSAIKPATFVCRPFASPQNAAPSLMKSVDKRASAKRDLTRLVASPLRNPIKRATKNTTNSEEKIKVLNEVWFEQVPAPLHTEGQ